MNKLLIWITQFLPCRIISMDGTPYLERYYVATVGGIRFYIHRFLGPDPSEDMHDHPWRWSASVVLSGAYIEQTRAGSRKISRFNRLDADSFHRVSAVIGGSCWTMFFHPITATKDWGFLRQSKSTGIETWVPHDVVMPHLQSNHSWWKTAPQGRQIRRSINV